MDKPSEVLGDARKGTLRPNPEWDKFMKQRVLEQQAEINKLKKEIEELRKHQARLRSWLQEGDKGG